jgi:hypothetical protein
MTFRELIEAIGVWVGALVVMGALGMLGRLLL